MRRQNKVRPKADQTKDVSEIQEDTSNQNTDQLIGDFSGRSLPITGQSQSRDNAQYDESKEDSQAQHAQKRPVGRPIRKRYTEIPEEAKTRVEPIREETIQQRGTNGQPTRVGSKFASKNESNLIPVVTKAKPKKVSYQAKETDDSTDMLLQADQLNVLKVQEDTEAEVIQPRRSQGRKRHKTPIAIVSPENTLSRGQMQQAQNDPTKFTSFDVNSQEVDHLENTQTVVDLRRARNAATIDQTRQRVRTQDQDPRREQLKRKKRAMLKKQARDMKRSLLQEIRDSQDLHILVSLAPHTAQMFKFDYNDTELDQIKPADFEKLILDNKTMIAMLLRMHHSNTGAHSSQYVQNQNIVSDDTRQPNTNVQEEQKMNFYQQDEPEEDAEDAEGVESDLEEEEAEVVTRGQKIKIEFGKSQKKPLDLPKKVEAKKESNKVVPIQANIPAARIGSELSKIVENDHQQEEQSPQPTHPLRKSEDQSLAMLKNNTPIIKHNKVMSFNLPQNAQAKNMSDQKSNGSFSSFSEPDQKEKLDKPKKFALQKPVKNQSEKKLGEKIGTTLIMGEDYENQNSQVDANHGTIIKSNESQRPNMTSDNLLAGFKKSIKGKMNESESPSKAAERAAAKKKEAEERKRKLKEQKELEKRLCEDCGGLKPPPMSPRSKQQLKMAKQKMEAARRRAANAKKADAVFNAVKKLPAPIRTALNLCGIGVKKKKQQIISYSQLSKVIRQKHPVDPLSGEKFDVWESLTVANYNIKLIDAFGCQKCFDACTVCLKKAEKLVTRKKDKGLEKPASMQDVPDGAAADSYQGLSKAALYVGEGPVLYLQIMKTLAILCVLLTIVNFPLLFMFSSNAGSKVNPMSLNSLFEHFSLGNVGYNDATCRVSHIHYNRSLELHPDLGPIDVNAKKVPLSEPLAMDFKCSHEDEYIFNIAAWGFLMKLDLSNETFSDAVPKCKQFDSDYAQAGAKDLQYNKDAPPWNPHEDDDHAESGEAEVLEAMEEKEEKEGLTVDEEYNEALLTPEIYPDAKNDHNIDPQCDIHNMFEDKVKKKDFFLALEQACYLKNKCSLEPENLKINETITEDDSIEDYNPEIYKDIDPNGKWAVRTVRLTDLLSQNCYKRIFKDEQTSPQFIGLPNCIRDYVVFPAVPSVQFHKEELGVVAVASDMISIFLMYYFFGKLKSLNEEYLTILDNNVIRMKDFTIQVRRVSIDDATQDLRILKLKIWMHFTNILKKFRHGDNHMEVVDVQFSFSKHDKHFSMYKLQEIKARLNAIKEKIDSGECTPGEAFSMETEKKDLVEKYERFETRYLLAIELEEKWAFNVSSCPANKLLNFVEYTYVTFKSNQAPAKAIELFAREPTTSKFGRKLFCIEDEIKDNVELEEQMLEVSRTVDPDQVIWNNIGFSIEEQNARAIIALIVQVLTAVFALLVTLLIGKLKAVTNRGSPNCEEPDLTTNVMAGAPDALAAQELATAITIVQARKANPEISDFEIQELKDKYRLADEMICFCKSITRGGYTLWNLFLVPWEDHTDVAEPPNYCLKWVGDTIFMQLIAFVTETSAVILNGIIAEAFSYLSKFKKKHTTIEEQSTGFSQIFFMEFFNMGLVVLITSFDPSGTTQRLAGQSNPIIYKGFENSWYALAGKKLCFSLFMSAFATNLGELKTFVMTLRARLIDRNFRPNLKKDLEDEDDDAVNSKCETQAEAEALYTGGQFAGEKTFSRMMSTLLVVVSYSSGMPILYFVGAFFFGVTYLVNKTVLIKYYQKSLSLNRVVPQFSMQFLSVSLGMHILFGCFMLTNPGLFETVSPSGTAFQLPTLPFNPGDALRDQFELEDLNQERNLLAQEGIKEELDPTTMIITKLSERMLFVHQQIYLLFVIGMVGSIFAGRFAWDILVFLVNKGAQLIAAILKLILKCLKFIANKIVEKALELKTYLRRQTRKAVKYLNYNIKLKKIEYGLLPAPSDNSDSEEQQKMSDQQKQKRIYYDFLIKPDKSEGLRINKLYDELMALNRIITATSQLKHVKLQGFLKKKVHEIEIFQTSVYPLRWYSIDFEDQRMFVKHGKDIADDDEFDSKMICFREFVKCSRMTDEEEEECKNNGHFPADKPYPFFLETVDRKFELCAQTEAERTLWVTAMEYISECVKEQKRLKFDFFKKAKRIKSQQTLEIKSEDSKEELMRKQNQMKKVDKEIQRFIDQIWDIYDDDGSGGLDIDETKGFLLDNWDHLANGKEFNDEKYQKQFKDFDEDGSGAIEKDEMADFLEAILNTEESEKPEVEQSVADSKMTGAGPKLRKASMYIQGTKPSKKYQQAVQERDKKMKGMKTQDQIKFLREWHEEMRAQMAAMNDENLAGEESEDPDEIRERDKVLAGYRLQIEKPYLSDNIFMELNIINLKQFYDRARKEMNDINKYFLITKDNEKQVLTPVSRGKKKPELRIQFEERCYQTKLSHLEVVQFLDFMKKRVKDIEEVIDKHFDMVKIVILKEKQGKLYRQMKRDQEDQKKQQGKGGGGEKEKQKTSRSEKSGRKSGSEVDKDKNQEDVEEGIIQRAIKEQLAGDIELQFENPFICTYDKKLQQLEEYEDSLLKTDREKKVNRRKQQTICRMQGSLTQSYFLWDAQQHKTARGIFYELESRVKEEEVDNIEEIQQLYKEMAQDQQKDALRKVEEEVQGLNDTHN